MNLLLQTSEQTLISFTTTELTGLVNSLNEVCNGIHIPEEEFATRLGLERSLLAKLHRKLRFDPQPSLQTYELVDVQQEPASIMVRAITVHGDPVEMSTFEAEAFVEELHQAIRKAS